MKFFWVDASRAESWDERKKLVTSALEAGAQAVVAREEDLEKIRKLGRIKVVLRDSCSADIALVEERGELKKPSESKAIKRAEELECEKAAYVTIKSKAHERLCVELAKRCSYVIAVGEDWKVIPLENLIAELQKSPSRIMAGVKSAEEARLAFETLEVGVDGVLLEGGDIAEIKKVGEMVQGLGERLELVSAKITRVEQAGTGDRVCVDTASLLSIGEGLLVGSQSSGLFLVHSETLESEYVAARPFRVNAGAVHAYVLAPGGKTKYLSELQAGEKVLAVNHRGEGREVVVGRVKIEKRPLLLIEAKAQGETFRTLLQNAETINLVTPEGKPISVVKLKPGDEVLIYVKKIGRHFGMEVEESIIER